MNTRGSERVTVALIYTYSHDRPGVLHTPDYHQDTDIVEIWKFYIHFTK